MRDTGKRVSLLFSLEDNLGKRTLLLSRINIVECVNVMAAVLRRPSTTSRKDPAAWGFDAG